MNNESSDASTDTSKARIGIRGVARATGSLGSRRLCERALAVYDRLFSRLPESDPDAGLGERYTSGRWALCARANAEEWRVARERSRRAVAILVAGRRAAGEDIASWLDAFPGAFLAALDRRRAPVRHSRTPGRRFVDAVHARPVPRMTPTRLIWDARTGRAG